MHSDRRADPGTTVSGEPGTGDESGAADAGVADERRECRSWFLFTRRAAGWWVLLAVVLAVVAANTLLASGPSTARPREVSAPGPEPQQGVSVAQREFGLLSGGGWAQAWTLWSDAARSALSQSDFVRLTTECHPALGVPYVIDATATAASTVTVTWHQASTKGTAGVVYENGAWRFVPDPAALAAYREGRCPAAQ